MAKIEDCPGFETFGADVMTARKAKQLSRSALALALQKAVSQGLLRTEDLKDPESGEKQTRFLFTPAAGPVLADLERARREYEAARLDTLTPEEQAAYQALSQKIQTHIQTVLQ